MSAAVLLPRLDGVRQNGKGWRANCPNGHDNVRSSLSITEADDGRVLLHCFACGDTTAILRALGLEMIDLYPERLKDPSPEARKAAQADHKLSSWQAALRVIDSEAQVVFFAAVDMLRGHTLSEDDSVRLMKAAERLTMARAALK